MDLDAAPDPRDAVAMFPKIGSYQRRLPFAKDLLDFWLTRFPRWYLFVEEHREWQNWDKRVYLSVIERGDTVMDVGANVGAHTVAFSHLVGWAGRVLSFEPVPLNFECLRETVSRRARYPNAAVFQSAVGDPSIRSETVTIKVPGDDFTQAALVEHSSGSWQSGKNVSEYTVALTSIDLEAERHQLDRLDFVKIDVEGGELDVIRGAASTLRQFRPLLYCEVFEKWAASFGYTPADLFRHVESLGYSEARIIREGKVYSLSLHETVPAELFESSADVLFSDPRHAARIARFDQRYRAEGNALHASR